MKADDGRRFIYEKNQLVEVICQLRFPAILSIDSETPAAFQEKVRARYPRYAVMTNFSPFKGDSALHPWMGLDRYNAAVAALEAADDGFDVQACFDVLRRTAQTVCPTVVSMVYDAEENAVYWCEGQNWEDVRMQRMRAECK